MANTGLPPSYLWTKRYPLCPGINAPEKGIYTRLCILSAVSRGTLQEPFDVGTPTPRSQKGN